MNSKTINLLGIVFVFFGLLTLMLLHLNHHHEEATEDEHEESENESDQYLHIAVGFPASLVGALLLILVERRSAV